MRRETKDTCHLYTDIAYGGGKNVLNLKREFNVTGLDHSLAVLLQAKK